MPIGDLARQDDYLPDVGAPLIPSGPQFSPGVPAVNAAIGSILAPQSRDPNSPVEYRTASPLVNITRQDIEDATNAAQAFSGGGLGIKAYHSSPYDFEKFDLSKIGTGEGAQVYGHGLYFAENPAVSGQGGQYWQQFKNKFEGPEKWAADYLQKAGFDREEALKILKREAWPPNSPSVVGAEELLRGDKPVGPRTYEVDIKADPAQLLNWDAKIGQQPKAVQDYFRKQIEQFGPEAAMEAQIKIAGSRAGGLRPVSEGLAEAGIPGIKYLDQGSRGLGDTAELRAQITRMQDVLTKNPSNKMLQDILRTHQAKLADAERATHNYVVFNPGIIDIMRKYGLAGAAPLGMGALAAQDNYQPQE
jgi:hypothetical protein